MRPAGHQVQIDLGMGGIEQVGHIEIGLGDPRQRTLAAGLAAAPGKIDLRLRIERAPAIVFHIAADRIKKRRKTCRMRKDVIMCGDGVQRHEAAHGAAADPCRCAFRQGGKLTVNERLELIDDPAHHRFAAAGDRTELAVGKGIWAIFNETAVAFVVALHAYDDERDAGAVKIVLQAPAFAIGRFIVFK